jgi:hypothetical protein
MCFPNDAVFNEKFKEERTNKSGVPETLREIAPPVDKAPLHEQDVKKQFVIFNWFVESRKRTIIPPFLP